MSDEDFIRLIVTVAQTIFVAVIFFVIVYAFVATGFIDQILQIL